MSESGVTGARSDMTEVVVPLGEPSTTHGHPQISAVKSETAPEVLRTPNEGLTNPFTVTEGTAAVQSTEVSPAELKERALVLLGEVCKTIERGYLHRVHYIKLAREYGCTLEQIAAEIGLTEGAVRYILKTEGGQ